MSCLRRQTLGVVFSFLLVVASQRVQAIDSPNVLPESISSLSLKAGSIFGLDEYYTNSGELKYLNDIHSVELNAANLSRIEPSVQTLVNVLNQFGQSGLGDQLYMGRLTIQADPSVTYFAPIYLYGLSKKLTVGVAVPIVQYKNDVSVTQRGSNLNQLREQFHDISPEVTAAFDQLDKDMRVEFNQVLAEKSYKPLQNKNQQFLGDVQLLSEYQFKKNENIVAATQTLVGLPTGPRPDADDLTDLENFHKLTLKQSIIANKTIAAHTSLIGVMAYQFIMPDRVEKRVPLNENDTLPDINQKMTLKEKVGSTLSALVGVGQKLNKNWFSSLGYLYEAKSKDSYSGGSADRLSLLEKNTGREAQSINLEITYSNVQDYFAKKAAFPGDITYEMINTVSGRNIENQIKQSIWLRMFF